MTDILLAKPNLPQDFIDVSVGEPHVVRENLVKIFDLSVYEVPQVPRMYEYPTPIGYKPLVQLLEEKYKAPVIITNGAKQALGAVFYALKQMGKVVMGMRVPYWALIPPLANMHGISTLSVDENIQSYLLVMPNNPDNFCMPSEEAKDFTSQCREAGMPIIHDAAYYTPVYMPPGYPLSPLGDVQVYSISKMLGLSGLRLGFVVCPNTQFYQLIQQYMETMTVGVSIIPQLFLYDLLRRMQAYPTLTNRFEGQSALDLLQAKKMIQQVDPEILEVPSEIEGTLGMFGFFKKGPKADFKKAKVNVIDGALFGMPGYIRMNLAFDQDTMQEIVNRLNSLKEDEQPLSPTSEPTNAPT